MRIIKGTALEYIPASHEDPKNPEVWKKVLCKKENFSEGKLQMINWAKLPVGKTFKAHYHEDMEEIFIIFNGKTKIYVGSEEAEMEKGDAVLIPPGSVHKMANICGEDVEYVAIGISSEQEGKTVVVGV